MKLHIKQIFIIVSVIGFVTLAGLFTGKTRMNEQLALSIPLANAAINPSPTIISGASQDVLIDKIIVVSGLRKQIDHVGEKLLEDIHQSSKKPDDPILVEEIEKIVTEIYRPEFFLSQLRNSLKQNFKYAQLETLVQMYSTPLMQKITQIESRELDLGALEVFIENLVRTPLSTNRLRLLQDLEAVTRTTEFVTELSICTRRALLMGKVNGDTEAMSAFDSNISAQKIEIRDTTYQGVIFIMAYSYQELTNMELNEYIQFYQTAEGKLFITETVDTLIEAFQAKSLQTGRRIAELAIVK
ncbi:hypothetical protein [Nitrosomonas marina]|uniref:DUF2059 domain-containing protein n=1 Tax=Nitrosomonas marina TaxID=917 RepID=A0A1H8ANV9_9PROT|nr:hypothetical protein [Nitrosomonas marina]SEM71207.1 hypothetical protein SAMN05216325_101200 [Nitrosomonas marina]